MLVYLSACPMLVGFVVSEFMPNVMGSWYLSSCPMLVGFVVSEFMPNVSGVHDMFRGI